MNGKKHSQLALTILMYLDKDYNTSYMKIGHEN